MINLKTKCEYCVHVKGCMNKGNAKDVEDKFHNTIYGTQGDEAWYWDAMMERKNVTIDISCPDFMIKRDPFGTNIR